MNENNNIKETNENKINSDNDNNNIINNENNNNNIEENKNNININSNKNEENINNNNIIKNNNISLNKITSMKEFFSLEICNPKSNNNNNKNENNNNNNNENNNNNKLTLTKNIIEENKDINELNTIKQVKIYNLQYIFKNIALQLGKNLLHPPRKKLHPSKIPLSFPRRIPSRSKIKHIYNL